MSNIKNTNLQINYKAIEFIILKLGFLCYLWYIKQYSVLEKSQPLAIFQPISAFGRSKSILVSQIFCTFQWDSDQ